MSQAATLVSDRETLIKRLRELYGERVSTSQSVLEQHGRGESWHPSQAPDAVCYAQTNEEVAAIVRLCAEYATPVIAYGTGTSLEGQVQAVDGGICIDLSQMNQVLEVNAEDLDCRVQAGVTRRELNHYLRDTGLFFPIDPGANRGIGARVDREKQAGIAQVVIELATRDAGLDTTVQVFGIHFENLVHLA